MKKSVVIGFLGTTLDKGPADGKRWEMWRPTLSLCQQDNLLVSRLSTSAREVFSRRR